LLQRHYKTVAALLVLALVLLAYSNSFNAQFHLDDLDKIQNNFGIRDISEVPRFFYKSGGAYPLDEFEFRPLKYATLAFSYYLAGYSPWTYHLFNLILHMVNCLLVFLAVRLVTRSGGVDGNASFDAAFVSASVFALHPLQTSTVMYLSNGRGVMLASMFYLLGFISYVRFRDGGPGRPGTYAWGALPPVFYMLGLLSKEITVTLPAVLVAYDWFISGQADGGIRSIKKRAPYYALFAAALALFMAWKNTVHGYAIVREVPYPATGYLMSEAKAFLLYLRLIFLPVNQNGDYFFPLTTSLDLKSVLGFAAFAAMPAILFLYRRKEPVAVFFGCWFIIALFPESSFVSFRDIAVEYRLYLPLAGFIAAACTMALKSRLVTGNRAVARVLFAALLVVYSIMCFSRNTVWLTEITFWRDAAAKSPWSARAHSNLGRSLLINKNYPEAIAELTKSLEVDPDYVQTDVAQFNLGMCYYENGELAAAVKYFEAAVKSNPSYLESYNKLGESYFGLGMYEESANAYRQAFEKGERNMAIQYNLATALTMSGQTTEAQALLKNLLDNNFDNFDVRYSLALLYQGKGEKLMALEQAGLAASMAEDMESRSKAEALVAELGG